MAWKIAIVVALLTAVVTAIVAIPVATYVAQANGVNDQDGGRSMAIFSSWLPWRSSRVCCSGCWVPT
ncbi:MAG: hypothetical protein IPL81_13960 [Flavobacteriales bacterium]|nr:hypothetical protein [Flavobacteriales bacterium]